MPEVNLGKVVGPVGPQGPTGPEGPQGVQGPTGPKGDPGSGTNPNLLMNWYFADPINQRGQREYTEAGYTIDRWKSSSKIIHVTLENGGVTLRNTGGGNQGLVQVIPAAPILGKRVTLTVLTTDGQMVTNTALIPAGVDKACPLIGDIYPCGSGSWCDLVAESSDVTEGTVRVRFVIEAGQRMSLLAVKLELGDHQTLAHQEGDKWVLNEVPDPALELLRCQRYYLRVSNNGHFQMNVMLRKNYAGEARMTLAIPTPVTMRVDPIVRGGSDVFGVRTDQSVSGENGTARRFANGVTIEFKGGSLDADEESDTELTFLTSFLELDAEL